MPSSARSQPEPSLRPETPLHWVRMVGNLVNLSTPAGLLVAALGRSTFRRGPGGLVLAEGYRLSFPVAGAFTLGNVIITGGRWDDLVERFPKLLEHEEGHTWQYLYCAGLPYLLAYSACMGWSMLVTGDRAAGNFFERQAGLTIGGYRHLPPRRVRDGVRALFLTKPESMG